MRFFSNGPNIPDDLLVARDQGRVVFFCGAGVSRAKAGFSGFLELAEKVYKRLGVLPDSAPATFLNIAKQLAENTDSDGGMSIDRAFGLLERDFATKDIYSAVASSLSSPNNVDLTAHETLVNLATDEDGVTRIVTTNFDRLFELCDQELKTFVAPNLPNLEQPGEFDGVVHLHGKINTKEDGAENDQFVLSSSEFGDAYIANAWATSFVKSVLERYIVVFVGYAADDPPIKYLLEALKRNTQKLNSIFAFEKGTESEAVSRWHLKGVRALPFNEYDDLWQTLQAWSERAQNPQSWYESVLENAKNGPAMLDMAQRGQVAHLMSTVEGSKINLRSTYALSADWLNVFDPSLRLANVESVMGIMNDAEDKVPTPFNLYGLDSDPEPETPISEDMPRKTAISRDVFDLFEITDLDDHNAQPSYKLPFRQGHYVNLDISTLPARLINVGIWVSQIADQPDTVKWVLKQKSLHPWVVNQLRKHIEFHGDSFSRPIYEAWLYILERLENPQRNASYLVYLERKLERSPWSMQLLRELQTTISAWISVREQYLPPSRLSPRQKDESLADYIYRDVEYPRLPEISKIPDKWLVHYVRVLRSDIENAVSLEEEVGGFSLPVRESITIDDQRGSNLRRRDDLSGRMLNYVFHFKKLIKKDTEAAKREVYFWSVDDNAVFSKIYVWLLRFVEVIPNRDLHQSIGKVTDQAFWCPYHSRDLMTSLSQRWQALPKKTRNHIERRIIKGPMRWSNEADEAFNNRKAFTVLSRIEWLKRQDCLFDISDEELGQLKKLAPEWIPDLADSAAASREPRGGIVSMDSDPSPLNDIPIFEVISVAHRLGRENRDFLTEVNPFIGLIESRPLRALNAIRVSRASSEDIFKSGWAEFLNHEARRQDSDKLTLLIAARLLQLPSANFHYIAHSSTRWLRDTGPRIYAKNPTLFSGLITKITRLVEKNPNLFNSAVVDKSEYPDWGMCSINSPSGRLVFTIIEAKLNEAEGLKFLDKDHMKFLERLLQLSEDLGRYGLVAVTRYLSWFYKNDPIWTEKLILKYSKSKHERDKDAFWYGTLNGGTLGGLDLFRSLKDVALNLVVERSKLSLRHQRSLTKFIFSAWKIVDEKKNERWVSNDELREVLVKTNDDCRCAILTEFEGYHQGWLGEFEILIDKVWPYQLVANSPRVVSLIAKIVAHAGEEFATALNIALPRMKTIEATDGLNAKNNVGFERYPLEALKFLYKILPDDIRKWPYGFQDYINFVIDNNIDVKSDPRFMELKRKWDSQT